MTTAPQANSSPERQELSLNDAASHVLEECRTVVPGMQALFGFQLIVVFTNSFKEELSPTERVLHLVAIIVARVILGTSVGAAIIAALLLGVVIVFWLVVPRRARRP